MTVRLQIFFFIISMAVIVSSRGQSSSKSLANKKIEEYIEYSKFRHGFDPAALDKYFSLFHDSAIIVFDFPFISYPDKNENITRIIKDKRQHKVIHAYGKRVPIDMYKDILLQKIKKFELDKLENYTIARTNSKEDDNSKIKDDIIIFEIKKEFRDIRWSGSTDSIYYLIHVAIKNDTAKIISTYVNSTYISSPFVPLTNVTLTLIDGASHDPSDKDYYISDVLTYVYFNFKDPINNVLFTRNTNKQGQVSFSGIPKSSVVKLDKVFDKRGKQYTVPMAWRIGMKVNDQPSDGFKISLYPYTWNGWNYSFFLSGGYIFTEDIDIANFKEESSFSTDQQYQLGFGGKFTYFINHEPLKNNQRKSIKRRRWLWGIGTGFSINYQRIKFSSKDFIQNQYDYVDFQFDTCLVEYSANSFYEWNDVIFVSIPLYFEIKKQISRKVHLSGLIGASYCKPLKWDFYTEGNFSRHGYYYDWNMNPVTDDYYYNYYTNRDTTYDGIHTNQYWFEGLVKLSIFLNVFNNPDNTLQLGLNVNAPFPWKVNDIHSNSRLQDYQGYWINTENDRYHSMMSTSRRPYKLYIGISVGINFIRYKIE